MRTRHHMTTQAIVITSLFTCLAPLKAAASVCPVDDEGIAQAERARISVPASPSAAIFTSAEVLASISSISQELEVLETEDPESAIHLRKSLELWVYTDLQSIAESRLHPTESEISPRQRPLSSNEQAWCGEDGARCEQAPPQPSTGKLELSSSTGAMSIARDDFRALETASSNKNFDPDSTGDDHHRRLERPPRFDRA